MAYFLKSVGICITVGVLFFASVVTSRAQSAQDKAQEQQREEQQRATNNKDVMSNNAAMMNSVALNNSVNRTSNGVRKSNGVVMKSNGAKSGSGVMRTSDVSKSNNARRKTCRTATPRRRRKRPPTARNATTRNRYRARETCANHYVCRHTADKIRSSSCAAGNSHLWPASHVHWRRFMCGRQPWAKVTNGVACTITASQPGNAEYYPAPSVSQTVNITP